ncbi:unnamed protein product [Notodromas monacha]|uniref:Uncharacterized protein n=1 Tax=Notodromas monacha TaxID=399045 RepID=A0A7R9BFE9_9CRUS|nr:unnamed protein product [Notodromas monacha]CAG0913798.1 unnamed protein product [Notodromas monacha]
MAALSAILKDWIADLNLGSSPAKQFLELLLRIDKSNNVLILHRRKHDCDFSTTSGIVVSELKRMMDAENVQFDADAIRRADWNPEKAKFVLGWLYVVLYCKRIQCPELLKLTNLPQEKQIVVEDCLKKLDVSRNQLTDALLNKLVGIVAVKRPLFASPTPRKRGRSPSRFSSSLAGVPESSSVPAQFVSAQKRRDNKIVVLEQELRVVKEENEELCRKCDSLSSQVSALQEDVKQKSNTIKSKTHDIETLESLLNAKESSDDAEERTDRLLAQLKTLKADLKNETETRQLEEAARNTAELKVLQLEENQRVLISDNLEIKAALKNLKDALEVAEKSAEISAAQFAELEKANNELKEELGSYQNGFDSQPPAKLRRLSEECRRSFGNSSLNASHDSNNLYMALLEDKNEELIKILEESKIQVGKLEEAEAAVKSQLRDTVLEKCELEKAFEDYRAATEISAATMEEKICRLTSETKALEKAKGEHMSAINSLNTELKIQGNEIDALTKLREEQEKKLAEASEKIAFGDSAIEELRYQWSDTENRLNKTASEAACLQKSLQRSQDEKEKLQTTWNSERDFLQRELKRTDEVLSEVKLDYETLKDEYESRNKQLQAVQSHLEHLQKLKIESDSQMVVLRESASNLETELQSSQENFRQASEKIMNLETELLSSVEQKKQFESLSSSLQNQVYTLETTLENVRNRLSQERDEAQRSLHETRDSLAASEILVENLQKCVEENAQMLESVEDELTQIQAELADSKKHQEILKSQLQELKMTRAQLEKDLEVGNQREADLCEKLAVTTEKILFLSGTLDQEKALRGDEKKVFESNCADFERTIVGLRADLLSSEKHVECVRTELEILSQSSESMTAELKERLCQLETDLLSARATCQTTCEALEEAQSSLESEQSSRIEITSDFKIQISQLQNQISDLEQQKLEVFASLKACEEKLCAANNSVEDVRAELVSEVQKKQKVTEEMQVLLGVAHEEKLALSEQLKVTKEEAACSLREMEARIFQLDKDLVSAIEESTITREALEAAQASLKRENSSKEEIITNLETEKSELKRQISELEEKRQEVCRSLEESAEELSVARTSIESLRTELSSEIERKQQLVGELTDLQKSVQDEKLSLTEKLEVAEEQAVSALQEMEERICQLETDLLSAKTTSEDTREALEASQALLESEKSSKKEMILNFETQLSELQSRISELEKQKRGVCDSLEATEKKLSDAKRSFEDLQSELISEIQKKEDLAGDMEVLRKSAQDEKLALNDILKAAEEKAASSSLELKERISRLEVDLLSARTTSEDTREALESSQALLEREKSSKKEMVLDFETQLSELQSRISELEKQKRGVRDSLEATEKKLSDANRSFEDLQSELISEIQKKKDLARDMEVLRKSAHDEKLALIEQLKLKEEKAASAFNEMKERISQLEVDLLSARTTSEDTREALESSQALLEREKSSKKALISKFEAQIIELHERISELEKQKQGFTDSVEALEEKLSTANGCIESLKSELISEIQKKNDLVEEMEILQKSAGDEKLALTEKLNVINEEAVCSLREQKTRIHQLESELLSARATSDDTRKTLEATQASLDKEQSSKKEIISKVEQQLSGLQDRISELEKQKQDVRDSLEATTEKLSAADCSIKTLQTEMLSEIETKEELVNKIEVLEKSAHDEKLASVEQLKVTKEEAASVLREMTDRICQLEADLLSARTMSDDSREALEAYQASLESEKSSKKEMMSNYESQMSEFQRQILELERQKQGVRDSLEATEKKLFNANRSFEDLQSELISEIQKKKDLAGDMEVLRKSAHDEKLALIEQLKLKEEKAASSLNELKERVTSLEQMLASSNEESTSLTRTLDDLKDSFAQERAQRSALMKSLEDQLSSLQVEISGYIQEKQAVALALEDAQSLLATSREEVQTLSSKLAAKDEALITQEKNSGAEKESLKLQLESVSALAENLKGELKTKTGEIAKLKAIQDEATASCITFATKYNLARPEKFSNPEFLASVFKKLDTFMSTVLADVKSADEKMDCMEKENRKLKKAMENAEAQWKQKEVSMLSMVSDASMSELNKVISDKDKRIADIKNERNSVVHHLEDLKSKLDSYSTEIQRQREQISTLSKDKNFHEQRVQSMKANFEEKLKSLNHAYERELKKKDGELLKVSNQLSFAETKLKERRKPNNDHIYETIDEACSRDFMRPPARRESAVSTRSNLSVLDRSTASNASSGRSARLSTASTLTLPCADELGELLSSTEIAKLQFGRGTIETALASDPFGRVSELQRRNSVLPMHLRSCYPSEMDVTSVVGERELKNINVEAMALDVLDRLPADSLQQRVRRGRRSRSMSPQAPSLPPRRPLGQIDHNSPLASRSGAASKRGADVKNDTFSAFDADSSFVSEKRQRMEQASIPGKAAALTPGNNFAASGRPRLSLAVPSGSSKSAKRNMLNLSNLSTSTTPSSLRKLMRGSLRVSRPAADKENVSLLENSDGSPATRTRAKLNSSKAHVFRNPFSGR